jgi:hypothetical protein
LAPEFYSLFGHAAGAFPGMQEVAGPMDVADVAGMAFDADFEGAADPHFAERNIGFSGFAGVGEPPEFLLVHQKSDLFDDFGGSVVWKLLSGGTALAFEEQAPAVEALWAATAVFELYPDQVPIVYKFISHYELTIG